MTDRTLSVLVDFGSTYTKVLAVDLDLEEVIAVVQSPSTVNSDIMIGLEEALGQLRARIGQQDLKLEHKLAASSAAGGLNMIAVGLVPQLTAEAARQAALGAGAKVSRVFSHQITPEETDEISRISPDIILLAGGTDGGNTEVILHNARALASAGIQVPVVVAGNKMAGGVVSDILSQNGNCVVKVENVMPELNMLNVEPARAAIRDIFMNRIVHAKGLDKAEAFVGNILMPTPMAVLNAARLLADGTDDEPGLGELVVVDVGGATTDVHSIAEGAPSQPGLMAKGLAEPYAKRTVEGDLGIRINAGSILETAGKRLKNNVTTASSVDINVDIEKATDHLALHTAEVPITNEEFGIDIGLARTAVDLAMERHAGQIELVYTSGGSVQILHGKDLTGIATVIGTGGIFAYGRGWPAILEGTRFREENSLLLLPKDPSFFIDEHYLMYAAGLLSLIAPDKALRIMKRSLKKV